MSGGDETCDVARSFPAAEKRKRRNVTHANGNVAAGDEADAAAKRRALHHGNGRAWKRVQKHQHGAELASVGKVFVLGVAGKTLLGGGRDGGMAVSPNAAGCWPAAADAPACCQSSFSST